ncbi:hypothetical protein C0993_012246 [Termitomyces sp. T159_Od127]|nr:hypothetical protein C0993_012246 [Termitomyces sp. T159_Od127]
MCNDSSSGSHNASPPRKRRAHSLSALNTRVTRENHTIDAQPDDAAFLAQLTTGAGMSAHELSQAIPNDTRASIVEGGCLSSSAFTDPFFLHGDVELPFSSPDFSWHLLLPQYQDHQTDPDQFKQTQGNSSTASSSSQPHGGPSLTIRDIHPSESPDHSSIPASASESASTSVSIVEPNSTQTEFDRAPIAEEKRRRNTEASARFRIKKKQRTLNLERTIKDLTGRAEDLEREAADLRLENGWLKEIVVLKGRQLAVENLASMIIADDARRAEEQSRSNSSNNNVTGATSKRRGAYRKK